MGYQRRSEHIQRKLSLHEPSSMQYRNTMRNSLQRTRILERENRTPKMDQRHYNVKKALDQEYMNRTPRTNPRHFSRTLDQVYNRQLNQKYNARLKEEGDNQLDHEYD